MGRIKAVEKVFVKAAIQNGGAVRPLTSREISVLKELEVQARVRTILSRQKTSGIEPSPEEAALILAHQNTEPVTGTVQKSEEQFEPVVIESPKGEAASDPNAKEGNSDTSSHHPLEGDGEDPVMKRQRENSQSSGIEGKKADSTMEDLGKLSLSQDDGESKGADAQKGEVTTVDGINVIPVVAPDPPLPKPSPVGAQGKRAKQAETRRPRRAPT
ncbi:MAG: hypothetical protein GY820_28420, partial [Gammaproteobacteria bacterium]|nr:hypothetical protein [Gammaproteobacteria bacterium]